MPAPRRHALLAGVDRYPHLDESAQLRSCLNDVRLVADVLASGFGFAAEDMSLLLDGAATRDALLAGLADLRARARPGDSVVFYWSGHGSQMEDEDLGEAGVISETIVPADSGREPEENRDIADDEIYAWLLTMEEVTTNVAVIADTCFSGSVVRSDWSEKWVEPAPRPSRRRPASRVPMRGAPTLRDVGPAGFLPLDERYVLLAACRFCEHAKELKSRPYSAFTYFLARELLRAGAGATYREVMERVRLAVTAEVPDQTPQVEGARDRVLFGAAERPPERFLPVLARQGSRVELGGGAVHGVCVGATWDLYPPGTRRPGGAERRGRVRIETVGAVRAGAVLRGEKGAVEIGLRAFERAKGPGWLRLPVALDAGKPWDPEGRALRTAIRRSPLLVLQDGGEAAVRVAALAPPIAAVEPSWAVLGHEDELLASPVARLRPGAASRLVTVLERLARARNLLALDGDAASPLAGRLEVELLQARGGEPFAPAVPDAGGEIVYRAGDWLALRVVQRAARPLYIHVLDVGLAGSVDLIYPVAGANDPLAPGRGLEIGVREGQRLEVGVPAEVVERARAAGRPDTGGREALLVLATTAEADLSGWEQPGWRDRTERRGLAALLERALVGGALRVGEPPAGDAGEDWTAVTRHFRVRSEPPVEEATLPGEGRRR